jgi:hypothetical protein
MESVYKVVIDRPYGSIFPPTIVGYVVGEEKAEKLKALTTQKIKIVAGWQTNYKMLPNGEPGVFLCKVCDLLDFEEA